MVSIPYEREGTWKVKINPKKKLTYGNVSIPYEREGTWKGKAKMYERGKVGSFNSLRTGRDMESLQIFCY